MVYKVIEVTGTSDVSVKDAVEKVLAQLRGDGVEVRFFVLKDTEIIPSSSGGSVRVLLDVGVNLPVSMSSRPEAPRAASRP